MKNTQEPAPGKATSSGARFAGVILLGVGTDISCQFGWYHVNMRPEANGFGTFFRLI